MPTKLPLVYKIAIILSMVLIFFPLVSNAVSIDDIKAEIEQKQELIKELERKVEQYQNILSQKQSEAESLENRIAIFDAEIQKLSYEIRITESKIDETLLRIHKLEVEIKEKEKELALQKIRIAEIIRQIHEYDETEFLELLLKTDDLSDIFNQAGYMEMLQIEIQEKIRIIKSLKEQLEEEKVTLNQEKEKQEELKQKLEDQKAVQESGRNEKQWLLSKTRKSESDYKRLLEDTEEKQRRIHEEIFTLEEELKNQLDPSRIPSPAAGIFSWPTEGLLTQDYGCVETSFARRIYPRCNEGRGGFHNGIDIAASTGTPIFAAADGRVIASGNAPYAYGKWIAVEHSNGLVTMYAHLSVVKVSVGRDVSRGKTIIGYMGSTGYSTGSHLHFTVYAPGTFRTQASKITGILPIGASLNPMGYL